MTFIKNLSLKMKLLFIAVPPLIIVMLYSILFLFYLVDEKSNLEKSQSRIKEAEVLAEITHFLQVERGLSISFVSSKGSNKDKIPDIRQKVNTLIEEANTIYSQTKGDGSILNKLNELSSKRTLIDELKITAPEVGAYYTRIIYSILDTTTVIPTLIGDKESRNIIQAYTHLESVKEQLGQIRANLNVAFSKNSFTENNYFNFSG